MSPVSTIFFSVVRFIGINWFIYLLSIETRFDFRSIARARACLITVARSDTVSSLTERISKAKRRSVYRPRAVGVGSAREWSVCSRLAAWRLRAVSLGFRALLGEPSKKIPNARGNEGKSGPGGRRKCSQTRKGRRGTERGRIIYTGSLLPSPLFFVFFFFCVFVFFFLSLSVLLYQSSALYLFSTSLRSYSI